MKIPQEWKALLGQHKEFTWKDKTIDEWRGILNVDGDFKNNEIKEI
jgi:hypothetical protein